MKTRFRVLGFRVIEPWTLSGLEAAIDDSLVSFKLSFIAKLTPFKQLMFGTGMLRVIELLS